MEKKMQQRVTVEEWRLLGAMRRVACSPGLLTIAIEQIADNLPGALSAQFKTMVQLYNKEGEK